MQCLNCKNEIKRKNKFCSIKCQKEYQYRKYIEKWKNNKVNGMRRKYQISFYIKTYIFEKYNNKCARCQWGEINKYINKYH